MHRRTTLPLFLIAQIGRNFFYLLLGQCARDRHHGVLIAWIRGIFAPVAFLPLCQFTRQVGIKLACQTRNLVLTVCIRSVAGGAGRNISVRNALFENLPAGVDEMPRTVRGGRCIKLAYVLC